MFLNWCSKVPGVTHRLWPELGSVRGEIIRLVGPPLIRTDTSVCYCKSRYSMQLNNSTYYFASKNLFAWTSAILNISDLIPIKWWIVQCNPYHLHVNRQHRVYPEYTHKQTNMHNIHNTHTQATRVSNIETKLNPKMLRVGSDSIFSVRQPKHIEFSISFVVLIQRDTLLTFRHFR